VEIRQPATQPSERSMTAGSPFRSRRRGWPLRLTASILGGCVAMLAAVTAAPARADVEMGPADGTRIYLSQACHNVLGLPALRAELRMFLV
jgi:hypothetical protein